MSSIDAPSAVAVAGAVGDRSPATPRWAAGRLRPGLGLAYLYIVVLAVCAIAPELLAPHNPLAVTTLPPFLHPFVVTSYPLGTDQEGRDVLSRIIFGARPSLEMGLGATGIGVLAGTALGLLAALGTRWTESIIMRALDVILSIPDFLLALVVIAILGTGITDALVAVGVATIPNYARMVRAQTHVVRRAAYVEAAAGLGIGRWSIVRLHVLPNAIKPVLVLATLGIGTAIGYGASLSFLGLGVKPPAAEWGSMLSSGIQFINNDWILVLIPGLAVTLTVLSVTVVGRDLKRRSEGRVA
jgi:peptide/nickel transport system permease protein